MAKITPHRFIFLIALGAFSMLASTATSTIACDYTLPSNTAWKDTGIDLTINI